MNGTTTSQESHPAQSPFHQKPSSSESSTDHQEMQSHHPQAAGGSSSSAAPPAAGSEKAHEKWGAHVMGAPSAPPTSHSDNRKAAFWGAGAGTDQAQAQAQHDHHHPYVQYSPVEKPSSSPMESILHVFNSWTHNAETKATNIWQNLKTNSSASEAAWGKMNLTAKALTGGGFETLYKQTFATYQNETLKKTFACYLSTSTGPVAGTLYLSNVHVAFCSDRPLSFTTPPGQPTWSYYKVMLPLAMIANINPVVMKENLAEKYIQIVTIDGHDFWFMGFVSYDKASRHLSESISNFVATGIAVQH